MFKKAKEIGKGFKTKVKDFCDDTCDYIEEHPCVFGAVVQGGFSLLLIGILIGCNSTEKEISKAYKLDCFNDITVNGKKLKKNMTFDEGMKYLDFCYQKGHKYKDWQNYLKTNGFID